MAFTYNQPAFWEWARSVDANGAGVDHSQAPLGSPPPHPFAAFWAPHTPERGDGFGPYGRCGPRGRHCRRHDETHPPRRGPGSPPPDGEEGERNNDDAPSGGPQHRGGPWGRRGGFGGRGRRGPPFFARDGGSGGLPFDLNVILDALQHHPWAQTLRGYAEQSGFAAQPAPQNEEEDGFKPPIDVFSTEKDYILHVALPGAKKEDVGVNWDAEKGTLNLAGVVYRQGDEEFLKTLSQTERKVGVFERAVKLPPQEDEKEEVDGENITAKLEDGVLVVVVPKVEKEWVDLKRVDIE